MMTINFTAVFMLLSFFGAYSAMSTPETTTATPETTTATPEAITNAPVTTTNAPETTTNAPEMTTEATTTARRAINSNANVESECSNFKPHPTNPHMFLALDKNNPNPNAQVYAERTCSYRSLLWNQETCQCVAPPCPDDNDLDCLGHRPVVDDPSMYQICVWGEWQERLRPCPIHQIWNQTNCRCDWDPLGPRGAVVPPTVGPFICGSLFHATFDKDVVDDGINRYTVGRDPWPAIEIKNVHGAVGGGAVRVNKGGLPMWWTSSNDLGDVFQIQLRFKLVADGGLGNTESVNLLSNNCGGGRTTLSLVYRPSDQRYFVFFRMLNKKDDTINCTAPSSNPFDFHAVSLAYEKGVTVLRIDGNVCIISTAFTGRLAVTACHVNLGGRGPGIREKFNGYFDEVIFRRGCIVSV